MSIDFKQHIDGVPDFPVAGVTFLDISPLLSSHFKAVIDAMIALFSAEELAAIDAFAGIDARGFIFAAAMAERTGKNMLMIRKGGKLPPPKVSTSYDLEYGSADIELREAAPLKLVLVDDVLATGGTLQAAADLCVQAGHDVRALATFIDLRFLNDFSWQGQKVRSAVQYES